MKCAGVGDVEAMRITGHKTRAIFDRYNIVDESDLANAAAKMNEYLWDQKRKRAAKLKTV
jgi:hypothetical protein